MVRTRSASRALWRWPNTSGRNGRTISVKASGRAVPISGPMPSSVYVPAPAPIIRSRKRKLDRLSHTVHQFGQAPPLRHRSVFSQRVAKNLDEAVDLFVPVVGGDRCRSNHVRLAPVAGDAGCFEFFQDGSPRAA